jgi:hypothetical protein
MADAVGLALEAVILRWSLQDIANDDLVESKVSLTDGSHASRLSVLSMHPCAALHEWCKKVWLNEVRGCMC